MPCHSRLRFAGTEYPALVNLPTNNSGAALGNIIQNNISYINAMWINWQDNAKTNVTVANNFTSGYPLFVNYSQPQLGPLTNSPAWALGFQPIPMNIGVITPPPTAVKSWASAALDSSLKELG